MMFIDYLTLGGIVAVIAILVALVVTCQRSGCRIGE